jgi:hypothetical protein
MTRAGFAIRCALAALVSGVLVHGLPEKAAAHDIAGMSDKFIRVERALAKAREAHDAVVASDQLSVGEKQTAQTYYFAQFRWDHASATVCFWQTGDDALIEAIMQVARVWTTGANIDFVHKDDMGRIRRCTDSGSADIRVTLDTLASSYYAAGDPLAWDWSRYGNTSAQNSAKVSMSLVSVRLTHDLGAMQDFNFLVAHEFGHALGLIHEHQRQNCGTWLDDNGIKLVWPTWTATDIQIFKSNLDLIPSSWATFAPTTAGAFDLRSIMMYNFDQRVWRKPTAGESPNPCVRAEKVQYPSKQDLDGVRAMYGDKPAMAGALPPAAAAPAATAIAAHAAIDLGTGLPQAAMPDLAQSLMRTQRELSSRFDVRTQDLKRALDRGLVVERQGSAAQPQRECIPNSFGPCVVFQSNRAGSGARHLRAQAKPQIDQIAETRDTVRRLVEAMEEAAALARQ